MKMGAVVVVRGGWGYVLCIGRHIVCFDVTPGSKIEFVLLMTTLCALHVLASIDKLDVTTANSLPPPGIPKDEFVKVFAANFILASCPWVVKLEKVVNLFSSCSHSTLDQFQIRVKVVVVNAHGNRSRVETVENKLAGDRGYGLRVSLAKKPFLFIQKAS